MQTMLTMYTMRYIYTICSYKYEIHRDLFSGNRVTVKSRPRVRIPPTPPHRRKRGIACGEFFYFTAHSFFCGSFPNRTRRAGLRFGSETEIFGIKPLDKSDLKRNSFGFLLFCPFNTPCTVENFTHNSAHAGLSPAAASTLGNHTSYTVHFRTYGWFLAIFSPLSPCQQRQKAV